MKEYKLSFTKENDGKWYIDYPEWRFGHSRLVVIAGVDDLCEELRYDDTHTSVDVITSSKKLPLSEGYIHLARIDYVFDGGLYTVSGSARVKDCWISDVAGELFGGFPKHIYIKRNR